MTKEKVLVRVREIVEGFTDHWDYIHEMHYTQECEEEQKNTYEIEVNMDSEGNILEDMEKKVKEVSIGLVLYFDVLG